MARNPAAIELEFSKLIQLNLIPIDEKYTTEIFGAFMKYINGVIYWADDDSWNIEAEDKVNTHRSLQDLQEAKC